MGSAASQRFAEFRDELPLKCQCDGIFVNMNKLDIHRGSNRISYTTRQNKKVSFIIPTKKYQSSLLYICSNCGHAIWVGDYTGGGSKLEKAVF